MCFIEPICTCITYLFEIYYRQGNEQGMDWLRELMLSEPVLNLQGYMLMHDNTDLTAAIVEPKPWEGEGIDVPESPLESFSVDDGSLLTP